MKTRNVLLVLCIFMLVLVPMISATPSVPLEGKDFVIRNESDSTNNYFVVAPQAYTSEGHKNLRAGPETFFSKMFTKGIGTGVPRRGMN